MIHISPSQRVQFRSPKYKFAIDINLVIVPALQMNVKFINLRNVKEPIKNAILLRYQRHINELNGSYYLAKTL